MNGLTDNVGAMLNGLDKITPHSESIVNNKRNAIFVGEFCENRNVVHDIFGVGDAFDENGFGFVVDGGSEGL